LAHGKFIGQLVFSGQAVKILFFEWPLSIRELFQDKGSPSLSSLTYVVVDVKDGDDLSPIFTKDVYETSVPVSTS
jgi:hypothetical protein